MQQGKIVPFFLGIVLGWQGISIFMHLFYIATIAGLCILHWGLH